MQATIQVNVIYIIPIVFYIYRCSEIDKKKNFIILYIIIIKKLKLFIYKLNY